jgi:hypothetical protein
MRARLLFGVPALVAAALAWFPGTAPAQGRRLVVSGVEFRTLSFEAGAGAKSVSELVVPIGVVWPLSRRVTVDVGTRFAQAKREGEDGTSATLSGLTDLQARAVVQVVPDRVLFTVAANLPTGKTSLTGEELSVAGTIASDFLPFPVSSFGNGSSVTTGLAVALPVGGWAFGLAGSYRLSGSYTPLAGIDSSYKAGAEAKFRVGLDRLVGQGRVSLGFIYSSFATDEFAGFEAFSPGSRYIGQASWSFPIGNVGVSIYGWNLYRGSGEIPANQTTTEQQNVMTLGSQVSFQLGRSQLRPTVEYRRHSIGDVDTTGSLLSLGVRYQMPLGERLVLVPALRFDTGQCGPTCLTATAGISGFSAAVGLRASL